MASWKAWQSQFGDLAENIRQGRRGLKRLLPLLYIASKRHGVLVDNFFMTCLRTAKFREELRSKVFVQICREVFLAFIKADLPAILLKGTALAQSVYTDPALRHCHNIDILLGEENIKKAYDLLSTLDFVRFHKDVTSQWESIRFVHNSGLPLLLHRYLLPKHYSQITISALSDLLHTQDIAGATFPILTPELRLVQVCCHSDNMNGKGSIVWVCDAWLIIHRYPSLDWGMITDFSSQHSIGLPLFLTLSYLAKQLNAPIPAEVLDAIQTTC